MQCTLCKGTKSIDKDLGFARVEVDCPACNGTGQVPDQIEDKKSILPGDIVQIKPEAHRFFGGCLFIVDEVKAFGFQGYIQPFESADDKGKLAYCRFNWEDFELTGGKAVWLTK